MNILQAIAHWIFHVYAQHQFPALFGFILIEEAGVPLPLPGDTLVALAGLHIHSAGYVLAVLATTTAAVFGGSTILYMIMRRGGHVLLEKYGRFLHLTPARITRVEGWFRRHGAPAIILGRLIPGLRTPTTVMAGVSEVPYRVFLPSTLLAALIWSAFYLFAGALLQRPFARVTRTVTGVLDDVSDWLILGIVVILLAGAVLTVLHLGRRWRRRGGEETGAV